MKPGSWTSFLLGWTSLTEGELFKVCKLDPMGDLLLLTCVNVVSIWSTEENAKKYH